MITGATHATIFAVYSLVPLAIALSAPFLWADSASDYKRIAPDSSVNDDDQDDDDYGLEHGSEDESTESWREKLKSAMKSMATIEYAWLLAIGVSGLVRITFYLGTLELQLRQLVPHNRTQESSLRLDD